MFCIVSLTSPWISTIYFHFYFILFIHFWFLSHYFWHRYYLILFIYFYDLYFIIIIIIVIILLLSDVCIAYIGVYTCMHMSVFMFII